jgi:hypothetical protein
MWGDFSHGGFFVQVAIVLANVLIQYYCAVFFDYLAAIAD